MLRRTGHEGTFGSPAREGREAGARGHVGYAARARGYGGRLRGRRRRGLRGTLEKTVLL